MINLSPDGNWRWDGYAWQPNVQPTTQVTVLMPSAPAIVKNKTTAVLLAVFLGFWTWVYTYQKDAVWFWLNLVLSVFTVGLWGIFVSWPWAIIQAAIRPTEFYAQFPYYNPKIAPTLPAPPTPQPALPPVAPPAPA
jgi:hypothetical protein